MNRTDFSVHNAEIDLADVVEDAARRYQQAAAEFGVTLQAVTHGPAPAVADADRVLQVVSNLVENALRLTPAGGAVRVVAEPGVLRVEDTGPGLDDGVNSVDVIHEDLVYRANISPARKACHSERSKKFAKRPSCVEEPYPRHRLTSC